MLKMGLFGILMSTLTIYFLLFFASWIVFKISFYVFNWVICPILFLKNILLNIYSIKRWKEKDIKGNHIAVVLCNNYYPERFMVYIFKIYLLLKYFKNRGWPFAVYSKVSKEKFREIVKNKKATILYVFGHGVKHGVKISKKEVFYYCDLRKFPKKKFIAQLHCNPLGGKSLVDYLSTNGFVSNGELSFFQLNKFIKNVVKGKVHGPP